MKERTMQLFIKFLTADVCLPVTELSRAFHCSERTLRNELQLINAYLVSAGLPRISNHRGKGWCLTLPIEKRESLIQALKKEANQEYYNPNERFFILLFEIATTTSATFAYEMEQKLRVSKSTLDEDMRRLRLFLENYRIEVISLPKQGIILQGDERSIRTMLYDAINQNLTIEKLVAPAANEVFSFSEKQVLSYLDEEKIKLIKATYEKVVEQPQIERNHVYSNQVILLIAIWIKRLQDGNEVQRSQQKRIELKARQVKKFFEELAEQGSWTFPAHEIRYISFIIESFNPKDMTNSFDWVAAQLLSIQLIEHMEHETGLPFSKRAELYEGLYKHITGLLSRIKNNVQVYNPLKETIQDSYSEIYQAIKKFTPEIERDTKKKLSEDEICFLTIYFSTSESQFNQEMLSFYQAVVICNHGISTGKLLAANLKEYFNIEVVAILSSEEIPFIDKVDIDLVFTTIPLQYDKKPLLMLNPILRPNDKRVIQQFLNKNQQAKRVLSKEIDATKLFQDIVEMIDKSGGVMDNRHYQNLIAIFSKHQLKFDKREIQPMLQDVLKESDILLQETCSDWKEAITKVAQPLVKESIIEPRYIEAMIQSVEDFGAYIVIGKHLALAHARPEDGVNQLGVSVMTLKEGINFGNEENDPVNIIFCLAAVDAYSHLKIMRSLINLINDEEKLAVLAKATTITTFCAQLYEEKQAEGGE